MACFHPLPAWEFQGLSRLVLTGKPIPVEFPCGKCIGCQQSRQRAWALRITHEAQINPPSCFITLTYNEPCYPSLNPQDFKAFIRRVVAAYGPTRYFMAGEYGSLNGRPHFHSILFGRDFARSYPVSGSGEATVYASPDLSRLWPHGFSSISGVTLQSARYVAKYTVKTARTSASHSLDPFTGELIPLVPEFARMSRRPGIGAAWFDKYWRDVYAARDGVCLQDGVVVPPPRYYDDRLDVLDPVRRTRSRFDRVIAAAARSGDSTRDRLRVRELCALAGVKQRKGKL